MNMATRRSVPRRGQLEALEEDIRQIGALLRGGRSPDEALAELRRRLDHDHMRDLMATVAMVKLLERRDDGGRHFDPEWIATAAYRQAESMLLARAQ
jgi:hypothetical protein